MAGFRVLILEQEHPSTLRREASFAEAAYDGEKTLERVLCKRASSAEDAEKIMKKDGNVALLIDPKGKSLAHFKPKILVDGTHASTTARTKKDMAHLVIGLGTGFSAGKDVDYVIESKRGHNLGRIIHEGYAAHDPGILGLADGEHRVVHAAASGRMDVCHSISLVVHKGDKLGTIHTSDGREIEVQAAVDGVLRGIIRSGFLVEKGMAVAEVDPRSEQEDCFTISDKARCIGGSVLEVVMAWRKGRHRWEKILQGD
jgi:xanthine dehydrogenase accessory factor